MKLFISALVIIGLAMVVDARVLKRQVQSGDPENDSFWNNFQPTSSTTQRTTTQSSQVQRCIQNCQATNEYNPICGTNGVQYNNIGRLNCARNCGVNVSASTRAACNPLT